MTEMTKREFFEAVIANVENEDLVLFAEKEIEKMNERNAKRKNTPSKTAIANEPIKAHIVEFLTNSEGSHIASEIANAVEISTQKASALCRQLVEVGTLAVEEVKVKGKGKVKAYSLAQSRRKRTDESLFFFYCHREHMFAPGRHFTTLKC